MENVAIVKKGDGIYLSVGDLGGEKLSRKEVLTLIDSYGLKEVDFVSLNSKLKGDVSFMDIKLTNQMDMNQKPEKASIDASRDKMEAFITFESPINNGEKLDERGIIEALNEAGIQEYNMETIRTLALHRAYGRKYSIAKGKPPTSGTDGYLQYHFNNENLRPKPKILEDGSVDFRQLGMLRLCERGDVLVTSVPPKPGVDGVDVFGNPIAFSKGRLPQPIPQGKNTFVSEDGLHLIADASGQLSIQNGKIHISPCLEIKGNVDNSTGNIDFNGQVVVMGNVLTGFTVKAVGNIEVHGVCEGAILTTDANIVIGRGAQGMEKAKLTAGGDITAKFIEACNVSAGGNITADSILNSTVHCGGDVILSGKRGLLTGGKLIAGNKLVAKTIGSPMGTSTTIEVGNNPQAVVGQRETTGELDKVKKEYEKVDQAVTLLTAQQKQGQLNDAKKQLLMKMLNAKMSFREKMNKLQLELDQMAQTLTANTGTVSASNVIQPGVKVTIGNAQYAVRDKMPNCTLRNSGEKITFGPYV